MARSPSSPVARAESARALSENSSRAGAKVVISDVQDARGEKLAEELGPNTSYYHTDVAHEEEVRAAVAHAVQKWGRLDVMFNNAGFGGVSGSILDTDMAAYDATMAVLLRGVSSG